MPTDSSLRSTREGRKCATESRRRSRHVRDVVIIFPEQDPDGSTPEWQHKLEASGLLVIDREVPEGFPDVMSAIYAVNGFEVAPTVTISDSLPDASSQLDSEWSARTATYQLTGIGTTFYVLAPVARGHEVGWIHVKDTIGSNLPSRIRAGTGRSDFLTMSEDGRVMCAVSTEEVETWIVVHQFP
ncbi:hypothetical protein [Streptomyces sp. NPDC026092]|uniref:hypothetical protein n=1 Tax=Streptomyces sp. NPDC026092 TaxID=3154797 RepID=UPI00340209DB